MALIADMAERSAVKVVVRICPDSPTPTNRLSHLKNTNRGNEQRPARGNAFESRPSSGKFLSERITAAINEAAGDNGWGSGRFISVANESTIILRRSIRSRSYRSTDSQFTFDHIYDAQTSQSVFYESEVCSYVEEAVMGKNVTVLATGGARSGKSYTMIGPPAAGSSPRWLSRQCACPQQQGIIPRALRTVYETIDRAIAIRPHSDFYVEISFVELINNNFRDLLEKRDCVLRSARSRSRSNSYDCSSTGGASSNGRRSFSRNESFNASDTSVLSPLRQRQLLQAIKSNGNISSNISNSNINSSSISSSSNIRNLLKELQRRSAVRSASKDSIEIRESALLGVILARPSGDIRVPAATAEEALLLLAAGCKARTNRIVSAGGHVSSR